MTDKWNETGATGNVGIPTLSHLHALNNNAHIVACIHNTKQSAQIHSVLPEAEVREIDFDNPNTFASALEGGGILFLLRPPQISDVEKFRPLLSQAEATGIKEIVFLSVQGADKQRFIPHAKIEKLIREFEFNYVFLRPGYFMQNLTSTLAQDVKEGTIMLPAGDAPFMWTDAENIGEVAARVLLRFNEYANTAIEVTGKELISFGEAIKRINAAIGSNLKYRSVNLFHFWRHRKKQGTPAAMIAVMIMLHFLPRIQKPPTVSWAYQQITGKEPTTLAEFAKRNMI